MEKTWTVRARGRFVCLVTVAQWRDNRRVSAWVRNIRPEVAKGLLPLVIHLDLGHSWDLDYGTWDDIRFRHLTQDLVPKIQY